MRDRNYIPIPHVGFWYLRSLQDWTIESVQLFGNKLAQQLNYEGMIVDGVTDDESLRGVSLRCRVSKKTFSIWVYLPPAEHGSGTEYYTIRVEPQLTFWDKYFSRKVRKELARLCQSIGFFLKFNLRVDITKWTDRRTMLMFDTYGYGPDIDHLI